MKEVQVDNIDGRYLFVSKRIEGIIPSFRKPKSSGSSRGLSGCSASSLGGVKM